jgi:TetR/AcrR family transcriptional regulator
MQPSTALPERTRRRNPTASRKALLMAARHEFAQKGLAGARVDEIAARAGVNKQLVYHHFGDKDALYLAVLEWLYEEIRGEETNLQLTGLAPEEGMRKLVASSFDHLAKHPDFVALLNDENRHGARHVKASAKLPQMHSPLVKGIAGMLDRGVRDGIFRPGVNAMQLYISIAALSYFFFSNGATLSAIFRRKLTSSQAIRTRREHVIDLIMHSLRP